MLTRHKKLYLQRPMKHKHPKKPINVAALKKLGVAFLITIVAVFCYVKVQPHTLEAKQQIQLEHKSQQLQTTRDQLETQKVKDADTQKKLDDTNKQLQETQKQLEAKRNTATVYAAELPKVAPKVTYAVPEDVAKAYIYSHESGNDPTAVNSIGCRGLGQTCPGTKLPCGDDYACQDAYFTQYMLSRYGSWANAQAFWINNHWW